MHEANSEKFNFSIKFSRIYFAENPMMLSSISENSQIKLRYNGQIIALYASPAVVLSLAALASASASNLSAPLLYLGGALTLLGFLLPLSLLC